MHATVQDYSPLPFIAYFWVHMDCFFMSPLVCRLSSVKGMYGSGVYFAQKARVPRSLHREVKVVQNCSHQQVPPLELFGSFFFPANEFVKILTDELEEWHDGWTGLFFSLRLAKRINTRDSAPILRSFPPGWVFGRKKASSQQLWVHSQPVLHFPWNQHSTLKIGLGRRLHFFARCNQVSCCFERLYQCWSASWLLVHQLLVGLSALFSETFLHPKWWRIFPAKIRSSQVPLATTTWLSL